jgi:AcrR family transcriptional regulator
LTDENNWFIRSFVIAPAAAPDSRTRTRILEAAEKRIAAFGYRRTGIAEIARDAGLAAGTVYRYFAGKEDVLREVVRALNARWLERAREALAAPGTAVERLTRLGPASAAFRTESTLIGSVFRRDTEILFAPLLDELHAELLRANVAMMADVIRDGIREGTIRDIDPDRAAYVLFLAGHILSDESHQRFQPYDDVLPVFADLTMNGLLPR